MASLENLDGFSNVKWLGGGLSCYGNPSLTSCCGIYQLLCVNPKDCTEDAVGGDIVINNNHVGNSVSEVIARGPCKFQDPGRHAISTSPGIAHNVNGLLYPNPATESVNINLDHFDHGSVEIRLVNSLGQVLWQYTVRDTDVEEHLTYSISPGMRDIVYYFVFVSEGDTITRPLIVQRYASPR